MAHGELRGLAIFCHFMIFASAVIVTGIVSWFISKYPFRGSHVVFEEVIAVLTIPIYLVAMFCPLASSYEGYFLPVNFIMSYLWITAFIFSASDWSGRLCRETALGTSNCSKKRAVESFLFIGFFFLLCNIVFEGLLMHAFRKDRREASVVTKEKERPLSTGTAYTANSTAPLNGNRNGLPSGVNAQHEHMAPNSAYASPGAPVPNATAQQV